MTRAITPKARAPANRRWPRSRRNKFDAVLLDVNLGQENGLDVLPEILKVASEPARGHVHRPRQREDRRRSHAARRGGFSGKAVSTRTFPDRAGALQRLHQMGQRIEQSGTGSQGNQVARTSNPSSISPRRSCAKSWMSCCAPRRRPASILILGESGTGKSVAARAVHQNSHLADKPVRDRELSEPVQGTAGERTVRPRARLVHRRGQGSLGQSQGRRRRHAVPRRNRRSADGNSTQTAAPAPGTRIRAARRKCHAPGQRARHRRHQSRPEEARGRRRLSRRPLFPA